jgi:hypothetical protein
VIDLRPQANRCIGGTTYGITMLSPIRADAASESPRADLAKVLAAMPTGADSPLARVGSTHLARWVIVSTLPFEGPPARPDTLTSPYLLFTANVDGDFERYIDQLADTVPDTVDQVWGHCVAYPGVSDRPAFRAWMRRCQIESTCYFGAYPSATVPTVLRALATQQALARFVADHADVRGAELQQAFARFVRERRAAPPPAPGTV